MDRLDASIRAWQEEKRLNPPKTDYVRSDGTLLAIPPRLLRSERAVLGMYKHLHYFCYNQNAPYTYIHRAHAHPIECITYMHGAGCISWQEMRNILEMPIQVRHIHEYLYRPEVVDVYPYRQFIVEYVGLLRFILKQHGKACSGDNGVRRFCYCWNPWLPPSKMDPIPKETIADSYENQVLRDKDFQNESKYILRSIYASRWTYSAYRNWFLAFDKDNRLLPELVDSCIGGCKLQPAVDAQYPTTEPIGLLDALRRLCAKWALTHVGTSHWMDVLAINVEHVDVFPRSDGISSIPPIHPPLGYEVRLPRYYGYSSINRGHKGDFWQLKYAMDLVKNQRGGVSALSEDDKIVLLRSMRLLLKRVSVHVNDRYRILKGVVGSISDSTLKKWRIITPKGMPNRYRSGGQVIGMSFDEAFALVMGATIDRPEDRDEWLTLLSRFKIDVDSLCRNAEQQYR